MTAMNSQQLDDLESAFLEAIEPGFSPRHGAPRLQAVHKKTEPHRSTVGSWWSNVKDKLVSKLICCAPSRALLDDDEIADLLASMEEPIKQKHSVVPLEESSSLADISFVLHEEKTIPVTVSVDYASDASTEVDESSDEEHEHKPTPSELLTRVSTAVMAVTTMQSLVHETKQRAAVEAIQQRWRQKKIMAARLTPTTPTVVVSEPEPEISVEIPVVEPMCVSAPSKRRRSRRTRKHRSHNKKSKTVEVEPVLQPDTAEVEAVAEPEPEAAISDVEVLSKKRPRTATTISTRPAFDLPTFHPRPHEPQEEGEDDELASFFGEETIDEDYHIHDYHTMARCASIVPPVTAFRPTPIKSQALQQAQPTVSIPQMTSVVKVDVVAFELVESSECEENSRMSEIRAKMTVVRQRLKLLRSRSSCSETEGPQDESDVFDWL